MKKIVLILLLMIFLFDSSITRAAEDSATKARQTSLASAKVHPTTLDLEFRLPIAAYRSRGITVPIGLKYSSRVWRMNPMAGRSVQNSSGDCHRLNAPRFAENSASGWTSGFVVPYLEFTGQDSPFDGDGKPTDAAGSGCQPTATGSSATLVRVKRILIHLPDGKTHELRDDTGFAAGSFPASFDGNYYATDGSNYKYVQDSTRGIYILRSDDGSTLEFSGSIARQNSATVRHAHRFTDRNGNSITFNETDNSLTDPVGRVLLPVVDPSAPAFPMITTYTPPGTNTVYRLHWKRLKAALPAESAISDFGEELKYTSSRYIADGIVITREPGTYLFSSGEHAPVGAQNEIFNPILLTKIELPTGLSYDFNYDAMGRMNRIAYPTGGHESIEYSATPPPDGNDAGELERRTNYGVRTRRVFYSKDNDEFYEWKYAASVGSPSEYVVTTINPDFTKSVSYQHRSPENLRSAFGYESALAGKVYREDLFSDTGRMVRQKLRDWVVTQFPNGDGHPKDWHPRLIREESRIYDDRNVGFATVSTVGYEGDLSLPETPVLVSATAQFPVAVLGSAVATNPIRTTATAYLFNDPNLSAATRELYKQKHLMRLRRSFEVNDADGKTAFKSETIYDESFLSPNAAVGNPTTIRSWSHDDRSPENPAGFFSGSIRYDSFGNRNEYLDGQGRVTSIEFDAASNAIPIQIATSITDNSDGNGPQTDTVLTASFDPLTGRKLSVTDQNGIETRMDYDPLTGRLVSANKYLAGVSVAGGTQFNYGDVAGNLMVGARKQLENDQFEERTVYLDGLARVFRDVKRSAGNTVVVEREFDHNGRVVKLSDPFEPGAVRKWTTLKFDEAGRLRQIISPDGSKVITDWGVLVSDLLKTNKTQKTITDWGVLVSDLLETSKTDAVITDWGVLVSDLLGTKERDEVVIDWGVLVSDFLETN